MAGKNVASTIRELIEETVNGEGFQIWDVEYVKEGASRHLRITIDSPDGVDIDGCERVHRAIDTIIDEADPIEESYYLEVSSPGIERELRTQEHFLFCIGEKINLRLFTAFEKKKQYTGILKGYENDEVVLEIEEGSEIRIPKSQVSKANIVFDFE